MQHKTLFLGSFVALTLMFCSMNARAQDAPTMPPPYNPYPPLPGYFPPTILPLNLNSELARVQREVQYIFNQYFAEYQALSPTPTYAGNPPILTPNGYDAQRILGGLLQYDLTMSPFENVACASCHMPYAAFSGPIPSVNLTMIAYPGSYHFRAAKRTAQRYVYSHTFPDLTYNTTQGLFFGGNFWDGRATGMKLQAPDAEQAQGPPVDPLEMSNPDIACIAWKISQTQYLPLFELVWATRSTSSGRPTLGRSAPPPGMRLYSRAALLRSL
jgi:cytochrome c peroxidase